MSYTVYCTEGWLLVRMKGRMSYGSAYMQWVSIELGLQLFQEGNVLGFRSQGQAETYGQRLLSKIVCSKAAQLLEVEIGEVLQVFPYDIDLGGRGGRVYVGLEGHSLRN